MSYDGFLAFGGTELINSERVRGYAESADCPMFWFKGPRALPLAAAVGDSFYSYEGIENAPWYDPTIPDISKRFYGAYGFSIAGVEDSTRSVDVTQSITDGGVSGRMRRATRDIQVKALLVGRGQDAVDYGVSWMNAVLDLFNCKQQSNDCETATVALFSAEPDERRQLEYYTDWQQTAINYFPDPNNVASAWPFVPGLSASSMSEIVLTPFGASTQARRLRRLATGTAGRGAVAVGSTYPRDATLTVRARIRASAATTAQIVVAPNADVAATAPGTPVTIPAGTGDYTFTVTTPNVAAGAYWGIYFQFTTGTVGSTYDITDVIATTPTGGSSTFFTGDYPSDDTRRYSWRGLPNMSPSQRDSRNLVTRLETDDEYEDRIDLMRRYMRRASATAGVRKTGEMRSGAFWGYEVTFTLTGGPAVLGISKRLVSQPSVPVVVQDVPYNLIPYPSAELSSGTVTVAQNLATNPSVELDAAGFLAGANTAIYDGGGLTGPVRDTAISAVGSASARLSFVATAAGSAGSMWLQQAVNLPANNPGARYSANLWATLVAMSGTPVLEKIEYYLIWRNASNVELRYDLIGTLSPSGGPVKASSILPPSGSTNVLIRAQAYLTSWVNGNRVDLYADALAVTLP